MPGVNSWPDKLPVNITPNKDDTVIDMEKVILAENDITQAEEVKEHIDIEEKNRSQALTDIDIPEEEEASAKRAKLSQEEELSIEDKSTFVEMMKGCLKIAKYDYLNICERIMK